jgi:very-short-patch-repair endonuclease
VLHGHRVDFFFRDFGVVVETDGLRYHRTPTQQKRDRVRDQVLTAAGLRVLRFTHGQVKFESDQVADILRRLSSKV